MSLLNTLIDAGSSFDWITPLLAQVQNVANGPHRTFLVSGGSGWSGHRIERLLRDNGVRCWGMMIVSQKLMLTVRQEQAGWTQYLLQREGIPLLNPIASVASSPQVTTPKPRQIRGTSRLWRLIK